MSKDQTQSNDKSQDLVQHILPASDPCMDSGYWGHRDYGYWNEWSEQKYATIIAASNALMENCLWLYTEERTK